MKSFFPCSFFICLLCALSQISAAATGELGISVQSHGAIGDGLSDDTAAIQSAVDAAAALGRGTVLFPPGTYRVSSIVLDPGLSLIGYGATIKKLPNQPKFSRTFTTRGREYTGDHDSPPLTIKGFTFDGSRTQQGAYTEYQLEQQHMIFLVANPKTRGKLVAFIEDCSFHDGVGDAISIYTNVSAKISNCTATDVFRGGVVVTGGHSDVQISNFTAKGAVHPTGIDIEVDGAGFGDSYQVAITASNLILDGDFDVSLQDNSVFLGSNIISFSAPFYLAAKDSVLKINNATFGIGEFSSTQNRIVFPHDVTLANCTFRVVEPYAEEKDRKIVAAHVYWNIYNTHYRDQSLRFINCDFQVDSSVESTDTTHALYLEADKLEHNNQLIMRGGSIADAFDHGVYLVQGGSASLCGTDINADTALWLGSAGDYCLDVTLEDINFGNNTSTTEHIVSHTPQNIIRHYNMHLDSAQNTLATTHGLAKNTYHGSRTLYGDTPPTEVPGLLGDIYHLSMPQANTVHRWICTASSPTAATWKAMNQITE